MKCDVCKEAEATVHLTQIVSGDIQKVDLCEACAKAKGVSDPTGFSLADMLLGLGQGEKTTEAGTAAAELRCAACGMTQSDFKKSGRLGCAQCYETFAGGLAPLLKGMHKGEQHVGKVPPSHSDSTAVADRLKALRRDLEQAVKGENFEVAAELRDRIRKLEQEGRG
ncbi:MAG: UvrB/UvrC motif-containing protein [Verrucomicrobia bacterium]|nr:UvrB/UvrC motif-containing protein [Verrucomicrobiota bacterium]